jgi:hypothetical protein
MQGKYNDLSVAELREMLLNHTLDAEAMIFEDYDRLFQYEIKSDKPDGKVIVFCSNFLSQHDKYNRDVQTPSFEELSQRLKRRNRIEFGRTMSGIARRAAVILVTITIASFMVQGVSIALGGNFFEFVRNWFRDDDVEISVVEPLDDGRFDWRDIRTTADTDSGDEPSADEFVFLDFDRIEDIDDEWLARVSPRLIEGFEFSHGDYMQFVGDREFNIFFIDRNEGYIALTIKNLPMTYVEREEELWVEDIVVGGIKFEIFRNIEDYHVIWEHGGYFYTLNAFLPLDEVQVIIENWY